MDDHPGGPEIILDVSGTNATEDFEDTGHSDDARQIMKEYYIGDLEGSEGPDGENSAGSSSKRSDNSTFIAAIVFSIIGIIAAFFRDDILALLPIDKQ